MTKTASLMMPLGTSLTPFDLQDVNGAYKQNEDNTPQKVWKNISSELFKEKPLLIMFICAHCPFVKHIESAITHLQNDYLDLLDLIAISSNSLITHPQDGPIYLAKQAKENGWKFPYLFDENQSFAKALKAACTPDFFLFAPSPDGVQKLFYRGQFDKSRPGNNLPVNGSDIRKGIDAILQSKPIPLDQKPSIGCNIKWHPGKEPYWFG